jgi:imidazolonepropionase-like amidohydrolase
MANTTEHPRVAIRAARLFDGAGTTTSADPVVVVDDGSIVSVECGPRAAVPPDAVLIELPGATLMPGLVDAHVHLTFDASGTPVDALAARDDDAALTAMAAAAEAQVRAGVTTVRDLGDRDFLSIRLREEGTGTLPTIVAAGPPITSAGGHCHFLGGAATGVYGMRAAVHEHVERGADVIKVMASGGELTPGSDVFGTQFSPAELRTVVDEAHRFGLPVTAHAHSVDAIADAVAAGVDGIEHCSFRTPEGVRVRDDLVAAIVARRIAVGATVGIIPVEGLAPPPALMRDLPGIHAALAHMIEEGALVVAGSDGGISPVKPHGMLPHCLQRFVGLGMTRAETLLAGTAVAAAVCGVGDRKGRVAPGFDADLLAVDGDPLVDMGAMLRPVAVLAGGRPVSAATGAFG